MPISSERIQAAKMNASVLFDYIRSRGEEIVKINEREYSLKSHDSMRINIQKGVWKRFSTNESGDFIKYLTSQYGMKFGEAVETLTPNWTKESTYSRPIDYAVNYNRPLTSKPKEAGKESDVYQLAENQGRVIAYLTQTRGISSDIVFKYINKKQIAQDTKGNAVFRILDENGNWKGAERRGTITYGDKAFKNCTPETGYGWTMTIGTPQKVCFFESAIDTLSYYNLFRDKLKDVALVSLAGITKETTLQETIKRYKEQNNITSENIWLCVDRDDGGDNFINAHKEQLGCKEFRPKPPYKDWNQMLVAYRQLERQSPTESKEQRSINDWKNKAQSRANERAGEQDRNVNDRGIKANEKEL